jgi:RHS repeat-associated protein
VQTEDKDNTKTGTTSKLEGTPPSPLAEGADAGTSSAGKHEGDEDDKTAKKGSTKKSPNPAREAQDGHPVDVFSGAVVDSQTDFSLPGLFKVVFTRSYNSRSGVTDLPFGRCGWTHVFHQVAEPIEPEAPDAPVRWRVRDPDGHWLPLGELPRDERVFLRGPQLEVLRRELTLEIRSLRSRLTKVLRRERVDEKYRLAELNNARGLGYRFTWEGDRLVQALDSAGREVRFAHDAHARIVRIGVWVDDKEQQWVEFGYHDAGELAWARNALGYEDRFEYDGLHRMVKTTLKNGVSFHYEYDEDGRCRRTFGDGALYAREFKRNAQANEVVSTSATEARVRVFDPNGRLIEERTLDGQYKATTAYDDDGLLAAEANGLGETTTYEHDERGNLAKRTDPAGNEASYEYEDDVWVRRTGPDGLVEARTHNQYGELLELTMPAGARSGVDYDEHGRVVAIYSEEGLKARLGWDGHHNLAWAQEVDGGTWRFTYDAMGRRITRTDPLGKSLRVVYDVLGQVVERTRSDGERVTFEYDALGQPTRVVAPVGLESRFEYAGTGVLTRAVLADGGEWLFEYDRDERIVSIRNPKHEKYFFTYDRLGRPQSETTFDGTEVQFAYDLGNRVRRVQRSDNSWRAFSYDPLGNLIEATSAQGSLLFERDKLGRVLRAVAEDGPEEIEVRYERDALGRVVAEQQGPYRVEFEYDERGRRTTRRVLGETTRYDYDLQGRTTQIQHEGRRVRFERNAVGREKARLWNDVASVESSYDAAGRLVEQRVLGPARFAESLPTDDAAARMLADARPLGDATRAVLAQRRWSFDRVGRLRGVDDRTWGTTRFEHDPVGRLLSTHRGEVSEAFDYDPAGSLVRTLRALDRRPGEDRGRWRTAPGNVLLDDGRNEYLLDACHRRVERIEKATGERTAYDWDDWDRLRQVRLPDGRRVRYFYDALGRRVRKELWRPMKPEEFASAMSAATKAASVDAGEVDAASPRVEEQGETLVVSHYVWDWDRLVGEILPEGQRVHVHEPESLVPLLQSERGEVMLVVADRNGAPRELVDERGAIAWAATYFAWGEIEREWLSRPDGPRSPFRLLGQYHDAETGFAATRYRYWDPATARWLSSDPLRLAGGRNLFAFNGNPLVDVDPLGLHLKVYIEVNGEYEFYGEYESGRDNSPVCDREGNLTWPEQRLTHTEPKALADLRSDIQNGAINPDSVFMVGELPPCEGGCQPAIRDFVAETGIPVDYFDQSTGTTTSMEPAPNNLPVRGDVIQTISPPGGGAPTAYRYWTNPSGGSSRAPYNP